LKRLADQKLALIGSGNMGCAMVGALLRQEEIPPEQITASDPFPEQRQAVASRYGVRTTGSNPEAAAGADILLLAVKPQVLSKVFSQLHGRVPENCLIFSIVAGTPITALQKGFKHGPIIRAMPNTPAQISSGMTVWTDSKEVTEAQRQQARVILRAMGKELYVELEDSLNMATAVSGTGPTYAFLLAEALVDAAVHLGFSRREARIIVLETLKGSVDFALQSDLHLAQLRNMVTSPGGTSAEAIYQMDKGGIRTILSKAVWAAYQKSQLLGRRAEEPPDSPLRLDEDS